jgi:beta-phosphoglucomutase family hydrolase
MVQRGTACTIPASSFEAVIFDLDGVITDTASVHAAAWKKMFDDFLSRYAARQCVPFQPFEIETDYRLYVDGKPRLDGLRSFLGSRGVELPEGRPEDPPGAKTIHGLGKRKNKDFLKQIQKHGADVYESTVDLIRSIKKHGLKTAVISSSKSCAVILDSVNLSDLFDVRVDGVDSEILGIPGKPAPDIFLEAARQLKVKPERAVVVEDAISGVQAGRAGNFGLVVGIARTGGTMLFFLFSAEEIQDIFQQMGYDFDPGIIPRNIDYYRQRSSHGSTLSNIVHSWILARSDRPRSLQLFHKALESDISDVQGGTTHEGIHLGAMAGTVDILQRCYTGLEFHDDILFLNPNIPRELPKLSMRIKYRGNWFDIAATPESMTIASSEGELRATKVSFQDKVYELKPGGTLTFDLGKAK